MCCCHSRGRKTEDREPVHRSSLAAAAPVGQRIVHRLSLDDRGVATLEGILVFALLVGVMLGCILLGQWGMQLQKSQMGARLLTFNAGDSALAQFGRAGDTAKQTVTVTPWDTITGIDTLPTSWLNTMFTSLTNDRSSGRVKGRQRGRLASPGRSLFDFSTASMAYFSTSAAGSNSWAGTAADAKSTFLAISYNVSLYQVDPQSIGAKPSIPHTFPVLESIFVFSGVR
jgi:hypothetical protein